MKSFHLHLISDSTGETVNSVSRAALAQFEDIDVEEHVWSLVRTKGQIEKVIESIEKNKGIVMYTMAEKKLRDLLKKECSKMGVLCIPVLSRVIKDLSDYLGKKSKPQIGKQHELDEDYFSRVDAINFALSHDDGQSSWDLEDADIVVIGVSRTSKSPTCVYLAYRGVKAANIPFVTEIPFPINPSELHSPLIVGLTISPERLCQIRKNRLLSINETSETKYIQLEEIKKELNIARQFFNKHNCPIIDVTRRSVEETAANILQLYQEKKAAKEKGIK